MQTKWMKDTRKDLKRQQYNMQAHGPEVATRNMDV